MNDYDYLSADHIGRTVEVRERTFRQELTTIYGDGTRETTTKWW